MDWRGYREASLDLHGLERDEAVLELDRWLHEVFLRDLREVRVVCGWGRGVLLKRIAAELDRHPLVESYRAAGPAFLVGIVPRSDDGL